MIFAPLKMGFFSIWRPEVWNDLSELFGEPQDTPSRPRKVLHIDAKSPGIL